jgi:hypothetical protein
MEKNMDVLKEIDNLEEGVASVTNWILGPADSMLNAHYQIGFDVASSEELRLEHEKLELECRVGSLQSIIKLLNLIYYGNLKNRKLKQSNPIELHIHFYKIIIL